MFVFVFHTFHQKLVNPINIPGFYFFENEAEKQEEEEETEKNKKKKNINHVECDENCL